MGCQEVTDQKSVDGTPGHEPGLIESSIRSEDYGLLSDLSDGNNVCPRHWTGGRLPVTRGNERIAK